MLAEIKQMLASSDAYCTAMAEADQLWQTTASR